jgi:hypothetical protein
MEYVMIDTLTSYPEVTMLLEELLEGVRSILGDHFVGMYLDGSLTSGDFDQDSDIDFVVVTDIDISGRLFSALRAMHDRIATVDSWCAIQLEGSYISQRALRRYDSAHALHPNVERGRGERLKMVEHDEAWAVHRYVLRERGITLAGPAPQTLIDPVAPADLRQAMLKTLHGWAAHILDNPAQMKDRGYQSYTVLTLCRVLYTLHYGTVASKPVAARWAQETLDNQWVTLIERAWAGRHNPGLEASPDEVSGTLEFIQYALEQSKKLAMPPEEDHGN